MSEVFSLDFYQNEAIKTAVFSESLDPLIYCALKLNGEAGEFAEKVGKMYRDDNGIMTPERREALIIELGDVLWYVSALAVQLNMPLSEVASRNLEKVHSRKARNQLHGSGDSR